MIFASGILSSPHLAISTLGFWILASLDFLWNLLILMTLKLPERCFKYIYIPVNMITSLKNCQFVWVHLGDFFFRFNFLFYKMKNIHLCGQIFNILFNSTQ